MGEPIGRKGGEVQIGMRIVHEVLGATVTCEEVRSDLSLKFVRSVNLSNKSTPSRWLPQSEKVVEHRVHGTMVQLSVRSTIIGCTKYRLDTSEC